MYLGKEDGGRKTSIKKTTVNLFVDSNVLEDIRKEAESENVSPNAKIIPFLQIIHFFTSTYMNKMEYLLQAEVFNSY
jgi:hypothetical protein